MCANDRSTGDTVVVSRLTAASAVDLLRDYRREFERTESDGPYLEELSDTITALEAALDSGKQ